MIIEYQPNLDGTSDINVWRAFPPPENWFYVGVSRSVWMVPGFEAFHNS